MMLNMAEIFLKLRFDEDQALGPGKVRLLELIRETGSISAAGREMAMSYRRAWILVDELNSLFRGPLVLTKLGGARGGGATLTPLGADVVRRYRAIEARVFSSSGAHIAELEGAVASRRRRKPASSTPE
jgi:molybdate transport system regulatory protein